MILKINSEHNFFLFQDIVYIFGQIVKRRWRFPLEYKFKEKDNFHKETSEYIYESWYEIFSEKLHKCEKTELAQRIIDRIDYWVITTNIAIIATQKGIGRRDIPRHELEILDECKPSFLIEHSDNFETYIVHLDEEMKILFEEAMHFYQIIENDFNPKPFLELLKRYFVLDDDYVSLEIEKLCEGFAGTKDYSRYSATYVEANL